MKLPLWFRRLRYRLPMPGDPEPKLPFLGIDVSEFNGEVDFQALKKNINFAILRCGFGSDYYSQDDACFEKNVQACQRAGIPYGVYLYACAQNEEMAKSEARHVIRLIKGKNPAFGVWYDVEDARLLKSADLVSICKTWCDAVSDEGIACVGLYASVSVMKGQLNSQELDRYEKWVAQWNHSCEYPNPGIWQFTDRAKLNGQVFDMNYAYKDYPNMPEADMTQDKFNEMLETYLDTQHKKPADRWAADAWDEACQAGLFDGTGPRSPLTREQAAVMLQRLKKT